MQNHAVHLTNHYNNILLGKNVYSTARTVSNTLAIDYSDTTTPLIYGEFDNRIVKIHGDLKLPSSGKKLFLGVSDNTSIGYDGTDLNIKSGLVAPSDLVIDCGTEKTLELTETVWDDWQGQLSSNQKVNPSAHIVDNNTEASVIFTTNCDTGDYIYMSPQMQHSWKLGSDIHPHLHWIQTTASQPNWLIQYRWQRNGQTKTTAWTDYALDTSVFTWVTGALLQITEGATKITPPTGYGISDIVQFRIIRDVNNDSGAFVGAETNSVDTESVSFDYHFQIDTLGSRTEFTK